MSADSGATAVQGLSKCQGTCQAKLVEGMRARTLASACPLSSRVRLLCHMAYDPCALSQDELGNLAVVIGAFREAKCSRGRKRRGREGRGDGGESGGLVEAAKTTGSARRPPPLLSPLSSLSWHSKGEAGPRTSSAPFITHPSPPPVFRSRQTPPPRRLIMQSGFSSLSSPDCATQYTQ